MGLRLVPITLSEAKAFVGREHRHHAPPVGHRFSIGVADGVLMSAGDDVNWRLCGVVVVGRPVARMLDSGLTAEVTRLATNGTKNACSILYAAAARAAEAMGYTKIQTYILASEPGTSLKAAGWVCEGETEGGQWDYTTAPRDLFGNTRRTDQPVGPKRRYAKTFK